MAFLDHNGVKKLVDLIKNGNASFKGLSSKVDKETGKNLISDTLITKLEGVADKANKTTFKVGTTTFGTEGGTDEVTFIAGTDIELTANATNKSITINNKYAAAKYTIKKQASAESGQLATYQLFENDTAVGEKINIPKDYLVKSGSVKTVTTANSPVSGYKVGDKYIDFVINTKDASGTDEHLYILVSDLVDNYTAGNGITIADNVVNAKVKDKSGITVDANGIAASLGNGLNLDANGAIAVKANGAGITVDPNGVSITVKNVTAGNGLTFTDGTVALSLANGTTAGALSSADFTKLSKLGTLPTAVGSYMYTLATANGTGTWEKLETISESDIDKMWDGTYTS